MPDVTIPPRLVCAGVGLLVLLSACGQKGPLFLPGERSEAQIEIPLPEQTDEESGPDEDDE